MRTHPWQVTGDAEAYQPLSFADVVQSVFYYAVKPNALPSVDTNRVSVAYRNGKRITYTRDNTSGADAREIQLAHALVALLLQKDAVEVFNELHPDMQGKYDRANLADIAKKITELLKNGEYSHSLKALCLCIIAGRPISITEILERHGKTYFDMLDALGY